jgi:uncharacterized membrane protein
MIPKKIRKEKANSVVVVVVVVGVVAVVMTMAARQLEANSTMNCGGRAGGTYEPSMR